MSETAQKSLTSSGDGLVEESIPYDASPQYIEEIAGALKVGGKDSKALSEQLDYSGGLIRRNLRFGVELGFFNEADDRFELTERGKTLGHMGLSEDTEWVFKDAVKNYPLYRTLIEKLISNGSVIEVRGNSALPQDKIRECINGPLQFDLGDRVLTGAVRTFMRTLDAAGYGRYVRGDGEYPTRIVLYDSIAEFGEVREGSEDSEPSNENDEREVDADADESDEVPEISYSSSSPDIVVEVSVEIAGDSDPKELARKVHEFEQSLYERRDT